MKVVEISVRIKSGPCRNAADLIAVLGREVSMHVGEDQQIVRFVVTS
jgi:hypothetical protein